MNCAMSISYPIEGRPSLSAFARPARRSTNWTCDRLSSCPTIANARPQDCGWSRTLRYGEIRRALATTIAATSASDAKRKIATTATRRGWRKWPSRYPGTRKCHARSEPTAKVRIVVIEQSRGPGLSPSRRKRCGWGISAARRKRRGDQGPKRVPALTASRAHRRFEISACQQESPLNERRDKLSPQ